MWLQHDGPIAALSTPAQSALQMLCGKSGIVKIIPDNLAAMSDGEGRRTSVSAINKICHIKLGLITTERSGAEAAFST